MLCLLYPFVSLAVFEVLWLAFQHPLYLVQQWIIKDGRASEVYVGEG
jgi:hypothetical protein